MVGETEDYDKSATPFPHGPSHEKDGEDEIDVTGLPGAGAFTDRGDPAGPDFTAFSLTQDGQWHDLDLSSIVAAGATLILLWVKLQNSSAGKYCWLRQNGNENAGNISYMETQVADQSQGYDCQVFCDANRVIEYIFEADGWAVTDITIKGWV